MNYSNISKLKLLKVDDTITFNINQYTAKYKVVKYIDGFHLEHNTLNNGNTSILRYLKIIDPQKFTRQFKCDIYHTADLNVISTSLENMTTIVKEFYLLIEKLKNN